MPIHIDQTGREVSIVSNPSRIISVVPSQTELLFSLGLNKEVIGITKFCIHPEQWFRNKTRIGGTKKLNIEKIISLKPDLILANKEENTKEQIEQLAQYCPVWISDIHNLEQALKMIEQVGMIINQSEKASTLINSIKTSFNSLDDTDSSLTKACYLIWKDPYMTVGSDTFISHMLPYAGFANAFNNQKRYPIVSTNDILITGCEVVLLSSEPYPFNEKHINELKDQLPGMNIILVDGEMFSWYGSRLLKAAEYFNELKSKRVAG